MDSYKQIKEPTLQGNLMWYGLSLTGLVLFLNAIAMIILSLLTLFSGEAQLLLLGLFVFILGALPSIGLGLWLWQEAASHRYK